MSFELDELCTISEMCEILEVLAPVKYKMLEVAKIRDKTNDMINTELIEKEGYQ